MPKPVTMPWLTVAVSETGPRRTGFDMCSSTVGNFTWLMRGDQRGIAARRTRRG